MNSVIGFSIFSNLPESSIKALHAAQSRALAHFPNLQKRSVMVGETQLELWGRAVIDERIHTLPDGSLAIVIGSPHGRVDLKGSCLEAPQTRRRQGQAGVKLGR